MARRPSSWVNLQDYLGLNADQGQEMGNRVASNIQDDARAAGNKISSDQRKFGYASQGSEVGGPDEQAFGNASANLYSSGQAQANAQRGYAGPQTLDDMDAGLSGQVSDAVARIQGAQGVGQSAGNELRKTYGGQAATGTGGSALDSFLMGSTSGDTFGALNSNYGDLQTKLGLANTQAGSQADAARARSTAAASRWGELAPVLEGYEKQKVDAAAAGERAFKQQRYDSASQQAWQAGHAPRGSHLTGTPTAREQAAMGYPPYYNVTNYDKAHPGEKDPEDPYFDEGGWHADTDSDPTGTPFGPDSPQNRKKWEISDRQHNQVGGYDPNKPG